MTGVLMCDVDVLNSFDRFSQALLKYSIYYSFVLCAEEILGSSSAIWMSNDGYLMLYGTFNDSMVEEQRFSWYGTGNTIAGNAYLYPEIRSLR